MGTMASSCIQTRCFLSSLSFSLPPVCPMWIVKDLLTLLHRHHSLHLSTQHHRQFRIIIQTLVCNLVEAVHYETLEETYQVQRCFTGKDRVCDTTYDIDT